MSTVAPPAQNTAKRDFLIESEKRFQKQWAEAKLFEANSPYLNGSRAVPGGSDPAVFAVDAEKERTEGRDKWFGTFPYPYMNGSLHLGHAFTISKIEFAAGFERMRGKEVLWPVGFHCTGMPIKAASDKLIREMEMFGPDFENYDKVQAEKAASEEVKVVAATAASSSDPSKGAKGKLNAKSTGLQYQFQIMESIGVKREEIKKFADTAYWLEFFPPIAKDDISSFGGRVDWRRSFITTPANPYYDSFVRWQMNKLKKLNYIKFGKRYTIFSPKDGQPCMDHDRGSGEGVGPQEYTGIKMPVVSFGEFAGKIKEASEGKTVTLVAATLRPETMYGQTACFVGPTVAYGLYPSVNSDELYLITPRAARNMAFQGLLAVDGQVPQSILTIKGDELVGTKVTAPLSVHGEVYVLPMDSVSATKGTAVVTCVPSDSPDDYITTLELQKKAAYYKIDPSWIDLPVVPVLRTPTYGDLTAKALVEKLKINSPKDVKQLAEAKEIAYKEGFYGGIMAIGEFEGRKVEEAKPLVREAMIKAGTAIAYSEPESAVMSRSADECVVALCDQWYLDYGQADWLAKAEKLLGRMNTYQKETRNSFEQTLAWLRQWACARSYGLGSKLPWDPQFLVESLSDSTVYMAYYTIAHLLHGPPIDGSVVGPLGITHEDMTDEVWDYIFASNTFPSDSPVPLEKANKLKAEFSYFYPMDIRSSGKDLIPNHLSFCIYVHAALFGEEHWPRSMRANGHLMLNGEKMAKSTGNSLTLKDSLEKFGADATRITLADAGDSIEDANFEEATANKAILRLKTLIDWCDEAVKSKADYRTGAIDGFWDSIFINEMNEAITKTYTAYDKALYKEALKDGFYELLGARDAYQLATSQEGGMHVDLLLAFIRTQALLLTPIAPHMAEYLWQTVLGEKTSVQLAQFPKVSAPVDQAVLDAAAYVRAITKEIRDSEANFAKKKGKGKSLGSFDPSRPKAVMIYVAKGFPDWQEAAVGIVKSAYNAETKKVDDGKVKEQITAQGLIKDKRYMPFIAGFKRRLAEFGPEVAFKRSVLFDEVDALSKTLPFMRRELKIEQIEVVATSDAVATHPGYNEAIIAAAEPVSPGIVFYNV